jgi:hypothetical protein
MSQPICVLVAKDKERAFHLYAASRESLVEIYLMIPVQLNVQLVPGKGSLSGALIFAFLVEVACSHQHLSKSSSAELQLVLPNAYVSTLVHSTYTQWILHMLALLPLNAFV